MNIHTFYNSGHKPIFDNYFKPSLKDDWNVVVHDSPTDAAQDCATPFFMEIILAKVSTLATKIIPSEAGNEYFIISDVDIQFFKPCSQIIADAMTGKDMVFQSENGTDRMAVNTGFIVMRPSEAVAAYWRRLLLRLAENVALGKCINEQDLTNEMIHQSGLNWGMLPDSFWCLTNPKFSIDSPAIKDICLHHANDTCAKDGKSSFELKVEQLKVVRSAVLE